MKLKKLIHTNISYYARHYRLVAAAALITVGVLIGSLVVGDSVRTTLVNRVTERLGDTETILFSRHGFMAEELVQEVLFGTSAKGYLMTNGFVPYGGKLIPVVVWGTDDPSLTAGSAKVNAALARELGGNTTITDIVLRLPATGLIPSGSLFVTESYTTSMRLAFDGVVSVADGGNLHLKNEQVIPLNIFVNRRELAETLETPGKINLILTPHTISADELNNAWHYRNSGLTVDYRANDIEIRSDRVFLPAEVTETLCADHTNSNRLFSYLANTLEREAHSVPYSFVTAVDYYEGEALQDDEVILSDYTAQRLEAHLGDTLNMSYFVSRDLKTLETETIKLRVKRILPLATLQADTTLSAEFPGLSDMERCTDWDSDLPIDLSLITDEDEEYWEHYRTTPKALIAYNAVAASWSNAYGNATAIRINDDAVDLSGLRAEMFGIQIIHPREAGLYAARNGVDFAGLFLALGFFIIVSAILLMLVPLSEMLWQRRQEIALLQALGYTRKRITHILWRESAPVVLGASVVGMIAGLFYTVLILWLLGNVWKGATHTEGFAVYPSLTTLILGFCVGVALSLALLRWMIHRTWREERATTRMERFRIQGTQRVWPLLTTLLTLGIIGINLFFLHSVVLFVVAGIVCLATAAVWGNYIVCRKGAMRGGDFGEQKIVWSTLLANRKQNLLSFFALATGVFIVFSVGLNRKGFADDSQIRSGTGGYALWCESSVPVYHNMATFAGQEKLSLTDLPEETQILQCLRYGADDASCLNLNKVSKPTVLGVDMNALQASDFRIEKSLGSADRTELFERMQKTDQEVYPALVDATVLTWGLMMQLGDTLHYANDRGETVAIQLVGTLSNSIFQGHLLIDRKLFATIWPETSGSEVFLLKVNENEKEKTMTLIAQALNEYGVRVTTTNDRLRQFNTVTDTYLTIFLTLGGLGLLLGIMAFVIVVRKNLSMRQKEINLYRTLGFTDRQIKQYLRRENLYVPLYAMGTGVISALLGVSLSFRNAGLGLWLLAALFALFFVVCVVVFVKQSVEYAVKQVYERNEND